MQPEMICFRKAKCSFHLVIPFMGQLVNEYASFPPSFFMTLLLFLDSIIVITETINLFGSHLKFNNSFNMLTEDNLREI